VYWSGLECFASGKPGLIVLVFHWQNTTPVIYEALLVHNQRAKSIYSNKPQAPIVHRLTSFLSSHPPTHTLTIPPLSYSLLLPTPSPLTPSPRPTTPFTVVYHPVNLPVPASTSGVDLWNTSAGAGTGTGTGTGTCTGSLLCRSSGERVMRE
jgi:hypothetical protein